MFFGVEQFGLFAEERLFAEVGLRRQFCTQVRSSPIGLATVALLQNCHTICSDSRCTLIYSRNNLVSN